MVISVTFNGISVILWRSVLLDTKSIVFVYHVATNKHKCILILIKRRLYVILTHTCNFKDGKQEKIAL